MHGREVRPGLLIWLLGVSAWLSWAPFTWRGGTPRFELLPALDEELIAHFLLLVPFAIGLSATRADRKLSWPVSLLPGSGKGRNHPLTQDFAILALMALFLEAGQVLVHSRSVSPGDWLASFLGGVLAATVTRKMVKKTPQKYVPVGVILILTISLGATIFFGAIFPSRGLQLESWNPDFSVVAGNEVGGKRRYLGDVSNATIRVGGQSNAVVLMPGASREDRQKAVGLVQETQSVTLQAYLISSSNKQVGPARVVSFSQGPFVRNATLGQEKRDLVLRLRTRRGGENGASFEFILREAVQAGTPTLVTAEFRHGVVTMRSESQTGIVSGTFRPDFLRASLDIRGDNFPKLHTAFSGRGALAQILLFLAGAGYLLGHRWQHHPLRALLVALALALGLIAVLDIILLQIPLPDAPDIALLSTAAALGVALSRRDDASMARVPEERVGYCSFAE